MAHVSGHQGMIPAFRAGGGGLTLLGLRARYGVMVWFGEATRHYWAVVGGRLVEAGTLGALDVLLSALVVPSQLVSRRALPSEPPRVAGLGGPSRVVGVCRPGRRFRVRSVPRPAPGRPCRAVPRRVPG